jgi:7-alpha-hydroxysteroid dehydrogenase
MTGTNKRRQEMILEKFSLAGKAAIVTGSGRGIGKAIAVVFAEAGADVVCCSRTMSEVEASADAIRTMGRRALAISCDVRDSAQVAAMVEKTAQEFGHIDILVNNAGGGSFGAVTKMPHGAFETDLLLNLTSMFICSKAVAKFMLDQKSGCIVNISSRESQVPAMGLSAYAAAKAAVNSFTLTLAWELGACLSNPDVVPERARFSVLFSFGSTITRTHS